MEMVPTGLGFTMTVAVTGVAAQPADDAVKVKVTVTGAAVLLVNVPLTFPAPEAGIPVAERVLSRVQLYTEPATPPPGTMVVTGAPEHTVCVAGVAVSWGAGFTMTVAVTGVPVHPLAEGVMVKVTVTGESVVLVSAPAMLPDPEAAIPVTEAVLLRLQLNVVPLTGPVSAMVVIVPPEHTVCDDGVAELTDGVGLTVIVNVTGVPEHPDTRLS